MIPVIIIAGHKSYHWVSTSKIYYLIVLFRGIKILNKCNSELFGYIEDLEVYQ